MPKSRAYVLKQSSVLCGQTSPARANQDGRSEPRPDPTDRPTERPTDPPRVNLPCRWAPQRALVLAGASTSSAPCVGYDGGRDGSRPSRPPHECAASVDRAATRKHRPSCSPTRTTQLLRGPTADYRLFYDSMNSENHPEKDYDTIRTMTCVLLTACIEFNHAYMKCGSYQVALLLCLVHGRFY